MRTLRELGLSYARHRSPLRVFYSLRVAREAGHMLHRVTGDKWRIVPVSRGTYQLQRYTGTKWVKG